GKLEDYTHSMMADVYGNDNVSLDYNTTMRQLSLQAEELAMAVRTQKYAYLPSLAATFAYNMNASTNDFNFSEFKWTPYSYVGLSLQIPIFSAGKRLNQVRQTKVQAAELDLQRKSTERQLKIAIRQYLNSMETDMKSYASAQEAVALAQKAYDISESSYELGKSTLTDLNAAQLALTQAKLGESQAIYNFIVAKSNLEKTLGYDFIDSEGNVDLDAKISE
ncbi:MAG: TolC family protein, partial [Bacteroidales bacterium]|nr:TolC family protein [Bacteroidales bacterium]